MIAAVRIVAIFTVFFLLTLALLPVQLVALGVGHSIMRRLPRWWHSIMCRVIGLRVRVNGNLSKQRPLLLVANHVSWKDIMVLGSVADVVFIAKSEVRGWPVLGWLARLQRSVFVEREVRRKTGAQISDVSAGLHGMPMGRYHRPVAGWPGDVALGPHLLRVIRDGALDIDVVFSDAVEFDATTNRKNTARFVEARVRDGLNAALRGELNG